MKYVATIFVALLGLILLCQVRILARLDEIAKRPVVFAGQPAPNAASIASEIRKQMVREARQSGPATFQIKPTGAGEAHLGKGESLDVASGGLQYATLSIVRDGGPAGDLAVTCPMGITNQFKKVQSTEDFDRFEVSFRPKTGNFLPKTWIFSLAYTAVNGKRQERSFAVTYNAGRQWPDYLDVREKNE